tara:strand:- start:561 stop:830 length:270 start_codon:yes stop_codon:yes gene_type:complete
LRVAGAVDEEGVAEVVLAGIFMKLVFLFLLVFMGLQLEQEVLERHLVQAAQPMVETQVSTLYLRFLSAVEAVVVILMEQVAVLGVVDKA